QRGLARGRDPGAAILDVDLPETRPAIAHDDVDVAARRVLQRVADQVFADLAQHHLVDAGAWRLRQFGNAQLRAVRLELQRVEPVQPGQHVLQRGRAVAVAVARL